LQTIIISDLHCCENIAMTTEILVSCVVQSSTPQHIQAHLNTFANFCNGLQRTIYLSI